MATEIKPGLGSNRSAYPDFTSSEELKSYAE